MLKAVIFDLGGTLMSFGDRDIGFPELERLGVREMYAHLSRWTGEGLPDRDTFCAIVESELDDAWRVSLSTLQSARIDLIMAALLAGWGLPTDDGTMVGLMEAYHRPMRPHIELYDDTKATLEAFREHGLRIGLVSNTLFVPAMHDCDLKRLGVFDFFDHIIYSSAFPHPKPHPAIFRHSLASLGAPASQAIFVGDRIVDDIGGAQAVGMRAVLKSSERDETHESIVPDAEIDTLRDLWNMVLDS